MPRDAGDQAQSRGSRSCCPACTWTTVPSARCNCPVRCAPISRMSSTLRLSLRMGGRGRAGIQTEPRNPGARAWLRRFPTGLGRPLGSRSAPATGPLQPPGRLDSGRPPGCRARRPPASRSCESPRAGPAPHANKQRVAWQRPRGGAAGRRDRARVRARSRMGAARGRGPGGLTQSRDSGQARRFGGHRDEGEGSS